MFFKPKPNVHDAEKARLEFHFQQVAECIGFDRLKLPVVGRAELTKWFDQTPQETIGFVGKHLSHDVSQIGFNSDPQPVEKCGSGGG